MHDERAANAGLWQMMRALPAALRVVLGSAWRGGRVSLLAAFGLQVVSGCLSAFGLLATAQVLTVLLAAGPTPQRLVAALLTLALLVAAYAVRGAADAGVSLVSARLSPRVRRAAEEALIVASSRLPLVDFDESDFYDSMSRARDRGVMQIVMATDRMLAMAGEVISLIAAAGVLVVLHPVLVPVLVLSVLPEAWATLRSAKLGYRSMLATMTLTAGCG